MKVRVMLILLLILSICMNLVYAATEDSEIVSLSLINQKPSPARAGEIVELRFNVENSGGKSANDLQIELIPEYPFIELPGEEYVKTIKTLSAYQDDEDAVAIKYKVRVDKDAVRGTNEIKIKEGRAGSDSYTSKTFDIDVSGKEFAQIIYVDKAKLDPGKETPLKFTITDIGNSPLQNLIFSWNEENGIILPVYSDNTKYIKYIGVGESVDLEYIVVADVNAVAGLYQLDLTLKFESEDGNSNEINTRAGVFVGGETDFDVTFSESSAGQTSLSVANIGNNPALSVTVRVPEQRNFRVTGSTSSIIGNLDKGDYTIVSFQIMQAGSMPGGMAGGSRLSEEERQGAGEHAPSGSASDNNNLEVLIEYTDTTGVRRSIEKDVPIQFRSITGFASQNPHADQSGMPGRQASIWNNSKLIGPIITLVIVVSGVVFYRKIRSRKKNK